MREWDLLKPLPPQKPHYTDKNIVIHSKNIPLNDEVKMGANHNLEEESIIEMSKQGTATVGSSIYQDSVTVT